MHKLTQNEPQKSNEGNRNFPTTNCEIFTSIDSIEGLSLKAIYDFETMIVYGNIVF